MLTLNGNEVPRFDSPNTRGEMRGFPTFGCYVGLLGRQDDGYEICVRTLPQLWLKKMSGA